MNSLVLVILTFSGFIVAYHTYGRFLSKKIFNLKRSHRTPSCEFQDGVDYVPTRKEVLFGHHFTSIAGLGPILGPAIGVIWGWVPAILWIFLGSIFKGAVHDFGSLVASIRNRGKSIGDIARDIISPRVRTIFLFVIFFELWIVMAIFALIIALLFDMYPESIFPVWMEIPIAMWLGFMVYRRGKSTNLMAPLAVIFMYISIIIGAYTPLRLPPLFGISPIIIWMVILFIYCYIASTLPVWKLLQPRDYINGHELLIMMVLLFAGIIVAHPVMVAPAINISPLGSPPMWPFLFVVIACGAISGFHSLVSSGTSSKQLSEEPHAQFVGYGGMLTEGVLSILVLVSVAAGIGLGLASDGGVLTGTSAWMHHYSSWQAAKGLASKINAFMGGAINLLGEIGIPRHIASSIIGVFLVSFAATTLDSATRIQRYAISELTSNTQLHFLSYRHPATAFAVVTAMLLAFAQKGGKGALILWPLFGTVNQLLAGLALLVVTVYLYKRKKSIVYTVSPMIFMIVMTGWAMISNIQSFFKDGRYHLFIIGLMVLVLEIWMIIESLIMMKEERWSLID
ncbi:MAG TPA: carbon starvation protein A [Candidatus Omnitrophica bacterium]|nr:carbon starvation protein A [Candidatus Omnitrophota bacterium]